ncbi:MAG: hypothetical protein ABIV47_09250 [Roseiflexaceae bacterium]
MQIGTPAQTQVRPTRLPSDTALPNTIATSMPSAAPSVQAAPELGPTPFETAPLEPTLEVEATPAVSTTATLTPAVIVIPLTRMPETNMERWRAQEQDRKVNTPPLIYIAKNPVMLWWYDPLTSQSVQIGTISGEFPAQAEFTLRSPQQAAFEVAYVINTDFGLTAISEAVRERMKAAGYTQSVEAYVLRTADIQPK